MKSLRWARRGLAVLGLGAAGGAAALAVRHALTTPQPLESGLPGEARIDREHGGELYYTIAGPTGAQPIVVLHDFYPGASSYEYSSLVPRLAETLRVYAPDWLGFGMSERPPLAYTGEFYASMLAGFLRDVVTRPAIVVATGRAANVAARAASDTPALFERLILISPHVEAGMQLDPTLSQTLVRLAQRTSLGLVPYALVTTRPVLRFGASRRGLGALAEDALDHEWAAAHQFGAQYAVLAALTGELDLPLHNVLPLLEPALLLVGGESDQQHPREQMEDLAVLNPYADLDIIPGAGAAVAQDQPARLATTLTIWLQRELPRHTPIGTLRVGSPAATVSSAAAGGGHRAAEPHVTPASGTMATLARPATVQAPSGSAGRADVQREKTADAVDAADAHEQPTAKRSTTPNSASTRQQTVSGPRPKSTTAGAADDQESRAESPRKVSQRAAGEVGTRQSASSSASESTTRSAPRRTTNPSRPRAAARASTSASAADDAMKSGSNGTRRAAKNGASAGRERSRSQTPPRAKPSSAANPGHQDGK
jgi:pimeloyl-ACP methyl ester carboxylesterase